jgi:CheY-like chemotaxis protein
LTLVKGLVEMHGGQLIVASPGRDQGSVFTIRLPLAKPETPTQPSSNRTESAVTGENASWLGVAAQQAGSDQTPVSRKVLVIDDRVDAILPIRVILRRDGHEVFEAHDGVAGVAMARRVMPDVVLCDIGLPGKLNGYDVVKELRSLASTRDALIVALSGYSQPSDRQRAREAGFDLHLAKPIDATRLRDLIRHDRVRRHGDAATTSALGSDPAI